jgi:hypothetical protein
METVIDRPGQLHFDVGATHLEEMLKHSGDRYQGDVTIVFEAQL